MLLEISSSRLRCWKSCCLVSSPVRIALFFHEANVQGTGHHVTNIIHRTWNFWSTHILRAPSPNTIALGLRFKKISSEKVIDIQSLAGIISVTYSNQENKQANFSCKGFLNFLTCGCPIVPAPFVKSPFFSPLSWVISLFLRPYILGHFTANIPKYYILPQAARNTVKTLNDFMCRSILVGLSVRYIPWFGRVRLTNGYIAWLSLHYTGSVMGRECGYWGKITSSSTGIFS